MSHAGCDSERESVLEKDTGKATQSISTMLDHTQPEFLPLLDRSPVPIRLRASGPRLHRNHK